MNEKMKGDKIKLPKGWKMKRLGEVCHSKSSNISQNKLIDNEGIYPIFGASGLIKEVDFYHHDKPYLSIVKDGSGFGRVTKMEAFTSVIGTLQYILPNEGIDLDYLNYSLTSIDFKKYVTGAAIPHIYFKDYKNEPFLWMPFSEQQSLVAILNKAFDAINKAIENAEQNFKNAKELFESYLQGVFENKDEGWEEKTLKEIASIFGRGKSKHRPRNWKGLYNGAYPFIQTGDVRNANKYLTNYSQTYNDLGLAQSKLWSKGTICITIAANIAETAILDFDACFPDSIIGLKVDPKKADLDFVYYTLQYLKTELQKLGKGSAQANINLGTFESYRIPFPKSIQTQQAIVQKLDVLSTETRKLENIHQQKVNDLEELKKAILQKAFAGELKTEKEIAV